jgi:hypothetical protein
VLGFTPTLGQVRVATTYKQQHLKVVNTPTSVKICSISICEPEIPRICFARKSTFKNWLSCICHQVSGFAHVDEEIDSLLNIDNFPMINAQKEFSIDQLRPPLQTFFFQSPIPHHQ